MDATIGLLFLVANTGCRTLLPDHIPLERKSGSGRKHGGFRRKLFPGVQGLQNEYGYDFIVSSAKCLAVLKANKEQNQHFGRSTPQNLYVC